MGRREYVDSSPVRGVPANAPTVAQGAAQVVHDFVTAALDSPSSPEVKLIIEPSGIVTASTVNSGIAREDVSDASMDSADSGSDEGSDV